MPQSWNVHKTQAQLIPSPFPIPHSPIWPRRMHLPDGDQASDILTQQCVWDSIILCVSKTPEFFLEGNHPMEWAFEPSELRHAYDK